MKPPFITDDVLLGTDTARRLYHEVAAPLPIIDYHNHLDAKALAADSGFTARHVYFRRILCDWLGEQVAGGRFPQDDALLTSLVRKLCYQNAKDYLIL